MKKVIFISTLLFFTAVIFNSCILKKMVKNASKVEFKTSPDRLEMHAGMVEINGSFTFPPKYFGKRARLTMTPSLKSDDGSDEIVFPIKTVIGEKFMDNYPIVIFKTGKIQENPMKEEYTDSYEFKDVIPYKKSMRMSDLNLRFQIATDKGKTSQVVSIKIADGVITTPELVGDGLIVDLGSQIGELMLDTFVIKESEVTKTTITETKIENDANSVEIYFELQKSDVKSGEIRKGKVKDLITSIVNAAKDPEKRIKSITIKSYASPDGPSDLNANLVKRRGASSQKALENALKKAKIEGKINFISTKTTNAEDWEGFERFIKKTSKIEKNKKDMILRVLRDKKDPEAREQEIKNITEVYEELKTEVLPYLRRSIIKFEYQTITGGDTTSSDIKTADPMDIQKGDFLKASSVIDISERETAYKVYTNKHPNDRRGWNNLAVTQAEQGKFDDAKINFEKVLDLVDDNPIAYNNLGAISMAEGDDNTAWDYFIKSEEAGCNSPALGYNMGVILIKRAKYKEAVKKMSGNSFNKALAQTLSGNNNAAIKTLNSMNNDNAIFYYLKAVTAAKAKNEKDVYENLKIAVSKDENLKSYAQNDLEFEKYFNKKGFKYIIK